MANDCDAVLIGICCCHGVALWRQPCDREASEHARNRNEWRMIVTQF